MPPLSIPWLRSGRDLAADRLTPAQRAVRVLQVTRANWPMAQGRRGRRRQSALAGEPLVRLAQPRFGI